MLLLEVIIDLSRADVDQFEAYEDIVLPLLLLYGGRVEYRVRAADRSSETHLIFFPDKEAYLRFVQDETRQKAQSLWEDCGAKAQVREVERLS